MQFIAVWVNKTHQKSIIYRFIAKSTFTIMLKQEDETYVLALEVFGQ